MRAWLPLLLAAHAGAQFVETSEQYREAMVQSEATLAEEIRNTEDTQGHFYPARLFFDRDQYVFKPPHPQLYAIGMIIDPCGCMAAPATCQADCCMNRFGSAVYPWIKRELVDYYPRVPTSKFDHMLLAPPDEILANVNLVDVFGAEIEEGELRRADDETFLAEECDGAAQESGDYLYKLGEDGLLRPLSDKTHCQGMRLGNRAFPIKPNCSDNNATVDARQPCTDPETGISRPNCVQVGIAQTAVVINCGDSPSDGPAFSDHPHCGTFLEIHRENGSPYDPDEDFIINEQRVTSTTISGYTTQTINMTYGIGVTNKILCNYAESEMRVGSMVFVKEQSPWCCCPPAFNNEDKTGYSYCPKNAYENTVGPWAAKLESLDHFKQNDMAVNAYPYCPVMDEGDDKIMCADYTYKWGGRRNYNQECPTNLNMTDIYVEEQNDVQECAEYDEDNVDECILLIAHSVETPRLTLMDCPGTINREGQYPSGPGTIADNAKRPQHNESWIFRLGAGGAEAPGGACFRAMVPGDLTANPPVHPQDKSDLFPTRYASHYLQGKRYKGKCFFFPGCAAHPDRQGLYADGATGNYQREKRWDEERKRWDKEDGPLGNEGCLADWDACSEGGDCTFNDRDTKFSFVGMMGQVSCMPTARTTCVEMMEVKYDNDEDYILVTFNNGRTHYPFRTGDVALHQPRHNYQAWWVQRTRYNFVIQQKKAFRVTEPTCTFDSVNDRYFPYTIIREDGSYVDTL